MMKFWNAAIWSNFSAQMPGDDARARRACRAPDEREGERSTAAAPAARATNQSGRREHAEPDHQRRARPTRARRRRRSRPVRQRRQQHEHEVAGDLRLDQRRASCWRTRSAARHHHEARDQELRVAHAGEDLHVVGEHVGEDQQVQQRGQHRRGHGLEAHLPEAQHFLVEQRREAASCAAARLRARMIFTNTSSRSARRPPGSRARAPASRRSASTCSTCAASATGNAPPSAGIAASPAAASAAGSAPRRASSAARAREKSGEQARGRVERDDAALLQHRDARAQRLRLLEVVRGEHDRVARPRSAAR